MTTKKTSKKHKYVLVATDVVILTVQHDQLKALLIKMKKEPFSDCWAVPGGLIQSNETTERAAKRHLFAKTGLKNVYLEQLYTFSKTDRDPFGRVVSVAYCALIPFDNINFKTTPEHSEVAWFPFKNLPKLAYDHQEIINYALQRLKSKVEYTNIIYSLLPKEFTLPELQHIYEIILNRKLDKRNFRRKFLSMKLIEKVTGKIKRGTSRPANLYTFLKKKPQVVEIL